VAEYLPKLINRALIFAQKRLNRSLFGGSADWRESFLFTSMAASVSAICIKGGLGNLDLVCGCLRRTLFWPMIRFLRRLLQN